MSLRPHGLQHPRLPYPSQSSGICSNSHPIAVITQDSTEMLSILQARLQQYVNLEITDIQGGFRKARGTRD